MDTSVNNAIEHIVFGIAHNGRGISERKSLKLLVSCDLEGALDLKLSWLRETWNESVLDTTLEHVQLAEGRVFCGVLLLNQAAGNISDCVGDLSQNVLEVDYEAARVEREGWVRVKRDAADVENSSVDSSSHVLESLGDLVEPSHINTDGSEEKTKHHATS